MTANSRSRSTGRKRGSPRGMNSFPDPPLRNRVVMQASRMPPCVCRMSRRWGSTWSTCLLSIPSAIGSAKGKTIRRSPGRTTWEVHGRSAMRPAATRRFIRSSARWTIFGDFLPAARDLGLEVALDIAFQCTPDHPWVRDHPEWFRKRPDGSIQYAENPPKKYQDIYPIDFETPAVAGIVDGAERASLTSGSSRECGSFASITRTPRHSPSGNGLSARFKESHPETIFLAEAFTRPHVMYRAGEAGVHAVLHLLHLAQHERGNYRLFHRTDAIAGARVFPPESMAEHSGHPARSSPGGRALRRSWCVCCWPRR